MYGDGLPSVMRGWQGRVKTSLRENWAALASATLERRNTFGKWPGFSDAIDDRCDISEKTFIR
jgi:hypothetical protein